MENLTKKELNILLGYVIYEIEMLKYSIHLHPTPSAKDKKEIKEKIRVFSKTKVLLENKINEE